MRKSLFFLILSTLLAESSSAQNVSEEYCKHIREAVIDKLSPTKIDTEDVYDDRCIFEITVTGNVDVSLDVEKYDTEVEGHDDIDRFLELLAVGNGLESKTDLRYGYMEMDDFWDEVFFVRATSTNSGVLMLRRGKTAVTSLSLKEEYLQRIERLLRNNLE